MKTSYLPQGLRVGLARAVNMNLAGHQELVLLKRKAIRIGIIVERIHLENPGNRRKWKNIVADLGTFNV
jgi:hypothetical protein